MISLVKSGREFQEFGAKTYTSDRPSKKYINDIYDMNLLDRAGQVFI